MGRKKDRFSIFSSSFSFLGKEWNRNWEWEKTSFSTLFSFFLFLFFRFFSFFSLLFSIFSFLGGGMSEEMRRNFPLSLPSFLLFWGEATGKNEGSSSYFSFLFSWFFISENPSLFQFFLLFREGEKDKGNCLFRDNPFLQEHNLSQHPQNIHFGTKLLSVC